MRANRVDSRSLNTGPLLRERPFRRRMTNFSHTAEFSARKGELTKRAARTGEVEKCARQARRTPLGANVTALCREAHSGKCGHFPAFCYSFVSTGSWEKLLLRGLAPQMRPTSRSYGQNTRGRRESVIMNGLHEERHRVGASAGVRN